MEIPPLKKVINCWSTTYSYGKVSAGDIVLIYSDGKEKLTDIVSNFKWYFYTEKSAKAMEVLEELVKKGSIISIKRGDNYIRAYANKKLYQDKELKATVSYLHRNGVKTYEADVGPAKRFLLDKGYELEDFKNINVLYFDIETDDSSGKIEYITRGDFKIIDAKYPILSFAGVTKTGKEYFICEKDEKLLLEKINDLIKKEEIDMLVGWNSKDFDVPYVVGRMDFHKINRSLMSNILHEDLMKRVQYFYSKDPEARQTIKSYSLNSISKYFLNEEKIERPGKVIDLMKEDFELFKEYNIQDCRLVMKLEEKLGLIDLTYQMFQMCKCTAQNWSMVKALDNFILDEGNKQQIHFPTNEAYLNKKEDDDSQYLGAFVLDPVSGYYEQVFDLDFKSLYPNIIRTFNISPDSRMKEIRGMDCLHTPGVEIDGVVKGKCFFDDEKQGIIPNKIKLLLDQREDIKKEQKKFKKDSREWKDLNVKQLVVKELANSIYGILGNKYFRSFDVDLAESITATGQYLIKWLQSYFNSRGESSAIYGDTDSVFVTIKAGEDITKVLSQCNRDLEKHIKETFHVNDYTLELALDKIFDKFLIVSKKKYAGISEGKMEIKGMECIKRDNIIIANEWQKKIIDDIFENISQEDMEKKIGSMKKTIMEKEVPLKKILVTKKLGKDVELYVKKNRADGSPGVLPLWVRVAKQTKNIKGDKTDLSKGGSIIQYVHTKGTGEAIHISEFDGKYDREHYWNTLIYPQIKRILDVVFPKVNWRDYYHVNEKINKPIYAGRKDPNATNSRKTQKKNKQ